MNSIVSSIYDCYSVSYQALTSYFPCISFNCISFNSFFEVNHRSYDQNKEIMIPLKPIRKKPITAFKSIPIADQDNSSESYDSYGSSSDSSYSSEDEAYPKSSLSSPPPPLMRMPELSPTIIRPQAFYQCPIELLEKLSANK